MFDVDRFIGESRRAAAVNAPAGVLDVVARAASTPAMWAVIGVDTGREDNSFWRRPPCVADARIEAAALYPTNA
jgi:hypothetical protein